VLGDRNIVKHHFWEAANKQMKKLGIIRRTALAAVVLVLSFILAGDTLLDMMTVSDVTDDALADEDNRVKVGLITTTEGISAETALNLLTVLRSEAFSDEIIADYIEPYSAADYSGDMEVLLRTGHRLIFCAGAELTGAVRAQAVRNPDICYVIINYLPEAEPLPENVIGIGYAVHEAAYLAGVFAANVTNTNRIGVIIGENTPARNAYAAAFYAGALSEKGSVDITGVYTNTMQNAGSAQSAANQIYANLADIIFTSAGIADMGVLAAARNRNLYAATADSVLISAGDSAHILIAAEKKYDVVKKLIRDYLDGSFKGGEAVTLGLKEGAIEILLPNALVFDGSALSRLESVKNDIISGAVKIPYNESELLNYFPGVNFMR
jgi:basic membrane protein A